jgi:hypothetical protein
MFIQASARAATKLGKLGRGCGRDRIRRPGGDRHPALQETRRIAAVTAHSHRLGDSHPTRRARGSDLSITADFKTGREQPPYFARDEAIAAVTAQRIGSGIATPLCKPGARACPSPLTSTPGGDRHSTLQETRRIAAVTAHSHRLGDRHSTLQARGEGLSVTADLNPGRGSPLYFARDEAIAAVTAHSHRLGDRHSTLQARDAHLSVTADLNPGRG